MKYNHGEEQTDFFGSYSSNMYQTLYHFYSLALNFILSFYLSGLDYLLKNKLQSMTRGKINTDSRNVVIMKTRLRYDRIVITDRDLKRAMINILRFIMYMQIICKTYGNSGRKKF